MPRERKIECDFKTSINSNCGRMMWKSTSERTHGKCKKHKDMKCNCGDYASHYCYENYACQEPLCDNLHCTTTHNEKKKYNKPIYKGDMWPK